MNACDSRGGGHLGSTLDMRQGSEATVQVPGNEGGGNAAGLACHMIIHLSRVAPAAFEQRTEQRQGLWGGPRRSGGTASLADGAAEGSRKCPVRPSDTTACTVGE